MEAVNQLSAESVIQNVIPTLVMAGDMIQLLQLMRHYSNLHVKYVTLNNLSDLVSSINIRNKEKLHHLLSFEKRLRTLVDKPKNEIASPKFMDELFGLYTEVLCYIYLGLLHGNVKHSHLRFTKADNNNLVQQINRIQSILNMKLETNVVINVKLEYKIRFIQKLIVDRICCWKEISERRFRIFDRQGFNFEKYQHLLHRFLAVCHNNPTLGEQRVEEDELFDEIAGIKSWLEKFVFLYYLAIQVGIVYNVLQKRGI